MKRLHNYKQVLLASVTRDYDFVDVPDEVVAKGKEAIDEYVTANFDADYEEFETYDHLEPSCWDAVEDIDDEEV